ncbi:MAG: TolC family outer membrane protein [Betaproteobacteria bacterium]
MKIKPSVTRIASLCAALFIATPSFGADLIDIYRDALAQDPVYASARYTYDAGREVLPQARATILPSIGLAAGINRNYRETEGFDNLDYNGHSYTLSLSQPLFRMQNWISVGQASLQVKQYEAVFADASQTLIVRTAQAYFDVLLAQDNVSLSGAQKTAISEQLAQAKRNFEVGTATITDTYEAQAKYDLAAAKEISDLNDLEIKKQALQQLIGKMPATLAPLRDNPGLALPQPNDMEQWVKAAEEASPVIAQLRLAYEIAVKEVSRNKAGHLPTVDLTANFTNGNSPLTTSTGSLGGLIDTKQGIIGLTLNIPLYQGGGTQSRIRQALSNKDRADQDLENTKRTVSQSVRQNYLGVTNGVAQVKALEAALVSNKSSLDATVLGKEVGVRTNVDVLNAQQQLFQAQRDLQQSRYTTIMSQLRLKAAAGRLREEDLAEVNRLLAK